MKLPKYVATSAAGSADVLVRTIGIIIPPLP